MEGVLLERLRRCETLPTLPAVAVQVLELVRRPSCQIPQLARLISKDPALASKILKTVNSSIYARPKKISRLTQALTLLGLHTVRVLALGFSLAHNLKSYKNKGFRALEFWRRCVYSATAALTLAQRMHLEMLEEAFIAGLLTDVGMLALHAMYPGDYDSVSDRARTHGDLLKLEGSLFGADHAKVGGALAELWQLPDTLATPIAHHHSPEQAENPSLRQLAEICQIAGRCADVFVEQSAAGAIEELRAFGRTHLNLDEAQCDGLLEQISRRAGEIAPLFDVRVNTDISVEEILMRANESVIQLTLEARREGQLDASAEHRCGLVDRTTLECTLARALQDAAHSHALLLICVDQLAEIGREHGTKIADAVMARVPGFFGDLARSPNLAAQFHEDRFAILLAYTDRHGALGRAEALRRTIHKTPLDFGRLTVPVTVSIGLAATDATSPFRSGPQLLKAAELALDAARHAGQNKVRALSLSQPAA
jgi:diguanylate cyclase (GGDEF)-like protein